MTQNIYKISLTFDQILELVQQLSEPEKEKLKQVLGKPSPTKKDEDLPTVFKRIGNNAQARGLTEEILEELLADES